MACNKSKPMCGKDVHLKSPKPRYEKYLVTEVNCSEREFLLDIQCG